MSFSNAKSFFCYFPSSFDRYLSAYKSKVTFVGYLVYQKTLI